jgi:hypothetical protein
MSQTFFRKLLISITVVGLLVTWILYMRKKSIEHNKTIYIRAKIIKIDTLARQILRYEAQSMEKRCLIYDSSTKRRNNIVRVGDSLIKEGQIAIFKRGSEILFIYENVSDQIEVQDIW